MRILILLISLSLSACANWQESLFESAVDAERYFSNLSEYQLSTQSHTWRYLDSVFDDGSGNEVDNRDVLILLHGFAVDKDNWIRFARNFPDYRVIIPDLPGHGESSFNDAFTYDFHNQVLWLNEFTEALALKAFHLVGNSMGGGIAAFYAHAYPAKVDSITLMDAAGVHPPKPSKLQLILDNNEANPLIVRSEEDFDRLRDFAMEDQPFLPWPAPGVLARKAMARQSINDKIFADINDYAEKVKVTGENLKVLSEINQPAFIIWGKEDRALDVSSIEVFEAYLPRSQSHVMEGVGHGPMIERPDESAELVKGFLNSLNTLMVFEE
jgi:pimeloyl-ACP methyl ester carboxylesterase